MLSFLIMHLKSKYASSIVLVCTMICIAMTSCASPLEDLQKFTAASNAFAVDLYQKVAKTDANIVCSPFSLSTTMAMVLIGARGKTAQEIQNVLRLTGISGNELQVACKALSQLMAQKHDGYQLDITKALWIQKGTHISKDYELILKDIFHSTLKDIDFQKRDAIDTLNAWVSDATSHRIQNLFRKPFSPLTHSVLVDAIYFNGKWLKKFDPFETVPRLFENAKEFVKTTHLSTVPMMKKTSAFPYTFSKYLNSQVLQLFYKGKEVSMVFVLPSTNVEIGDVESKLKSDVLVSLLANLTLTDDVEVRIPKFKVDTTLALEHILSDLGMKEVFLETADLSGITASKDLRVSNVVQNSVIKVDEQGTEAASAIEMEMTLLSLPFSTVVFDAKKPFLYFMVLEPMKLILFMGRVMVL